VLLTLWPLNFNRPRPGLNPRILGPIARMLTTRPTRRRLYQYIFSIFVNELITFYSFDFRNVKDYFIRENNPISVAVMYIISLHLKVAEVLC
jgi:hypothetical protein